MSSFHSLCRASLSGALLLVLALASTGCGKDASDCAGVMGCECEVDAQCNERNMCVTGTCVPLLATTPDRGAVDAPCHPDGSCDAGGRCVAGTCEACVGESGCACGFDGSCSGGLGCVQGFCSNPQRPPSNPRCYSPCSSSFTDTATGEWVRCDSDGLFEGCRGDNVCAAGSCQAAQSAASPFAAEVGECDDDVGCAAWQSCIEGRCYSTCESNSECELGDGVNRACHMHVCRVRCLSGANNCGPGTFCDASNGETGYCMPVENGAGVEVEPPNIFELSELRLHLNPARTSGTLTLENLGDQEETYTFTKAQGPLGPQNGVLDWLTINGSAEPQVEVTVAAGETATITIADTATTLHSSWSGHLRVAPENGGNKELHLLFFGSPDGQWLGKMVYFANFPDRYLDEWGEDASSVTNAQLDNAFIVLWNRFAAGNLSLDEFQAVLQSTQKQSWKSDLMQEFCGNDPQRACYPYDNANGFGVYTTSLNSQDIPSGATDLPMVMNLKSSADPKVMTGRIETSRTLHFPSNPHVDLTFEDDPSTCSVASDGTLLCRVDTMSATALVGGRYLSSRGGDCDLSVVGADSGYQEHKIPWLVPGLKNNTEFDSGEGRLYRYECRDSLLPLSAGAAPSADEMKLNLSLAGANPIPDGNTRVREIEVLDGVMIDQKELVLIFRETFVSFLGTGGGDTFSAYGIMTLSKGKKDLEPSEYVGSTQAEEREFDQGLAMPTCDAGLLEELADSINRQTPIDLDDATDARTLTGLLVDGFSQEPSVDDLLNPLLEHAHHYCEDTGLIDGGRHGDVPCPGSSGGFFFTVTAPTTAADVKAASCNNPAGITVTPKDSLTYMKCTTPGAVCDCRQTPSACTVCATSGGEGCYPVVNDTLTDVYEVTVAQPADCLAQITDWESSPQVTLRRNPVWSCKPVMNAGGTSERPSSCMLGTGDNGLPLVDRTINKDFYASGSTSVVAPSLRNRVADAFRYKTRFRSRTGGNVGFAPEICADGVPYCFNPSEIEDIGRRVDCLLDLYERHIDGDFGTEPPPSEKLVAQRYLTQNFSQEEILFTQPVTGQAELLPYPIINEGFERLLTELMVMLGDEALTQSYASRFDLAGSNQLGFEGDYFEPGGLRLSGGAGFEMHKLYQSVQYYQYALDRFYKLSPLIWKSANEYGPTTVDGYINDSTVTAYLERLIRASTQKALAHAEIASRYANFNEPELARHIIERAYTATYIESIFISRTMLHLLESSAVGGAARPQIKKTVERAQLTYRSALLRMQEAYEKITDDLTFFGYAPDYVPFPALNPDNVHQDNAFQVILASARTRLDVASEKEDLALAQNQSYEVDAVAFQNEILSIQWNYEGELRDLCGTFVGSDGNIYAAIAEYAPMIPGGVTAGDPCGGVGTGQITEAMNELQVASLDVLSAKQALQDFLVRQQIIEDSVTAQCQLIDGIANYQFSSDTQVNAWEKSIRDKQQGIDALDQFYQQTVDAASILASGDIFTKAGSVAASLTVTAIGVSNFIAGTVLRNEIADLESDIDDKEAATARWVTQQECNFALIEANKETRELLLDGYHLEIEAKQAVLAAQAVASRLNGLFQLAQALQSEMLDDQQLAINLEAARNDPNVRIYKNDAIRTADRTFTRAITEAYRLTKVYEYYTSTSYAKLGELFLIRLVSRGDITLEAYLDELEDAFGAFEEEYGRPDLRVLTVSAKDDVLKIPRLNGDSQSLSIEKRNELFRDAIFDAARLDENGHVKVGFPVTLTQLSPLTRNHKVERVEVELLGEDGDEVTRVYLRQEGTGVVRGVDGDKIYFTFPPRTAVVNSFMNGRKPFDPAVYQNRRLRDRPLANTAWSLLMNFRDESDNFDLDASSLSDVRIYFYYTDFTAL